MASDFSDPLQWVPLIGGFIGMAVGLLSIWSTIKTAARNQKKDMEESNLASENRMKEFFDLKLKVVDVKIDAIKDDVEKQEGKDSESHGFFKDWLQRLEDEIDTSRHKRTQK